LGGWTFVFDKAQRRAGICRYAQQIIGLSKPMVVSHDRPFSDIRNIILHEMAHALVGSKHGHDAVWRKKANEIGCTRDRCHQMHFANYRWHITCPCGANDLKRLKLTKRMKSAVCSRCRNPLQVRDLGRNGTTAKHNTVCE
jgi:predicted SprT family Zn-dependent metalloprotease